MKKFIGLIFLVILVVYGLIYYNRVNYNKVISDKNSAYIHKEVFAKDSDGKGYSDEAKRLMDEDLQIVNNDPKIQKLYILYEKTQRLLVLSHSKNQFTQNFILRHKISICLDSIMYEKYRGVYFKNIYNRSKGNESQQMKLVIDFLDRDFLSKNTAKENWTLLNSMPTDQECERFLNE